jgi:probable HAF family extracellular repeat protein
MVLLPTFGALGFANGASAINSSGQLAGSLEVSPPFNNTTSLAAIWSGNQTTLIAPLPGSQGCGADGINDLGQVAGTCENPAYVGSAFLYDRGRVLNLGTLDGGRGDTAAFAINNLGQVVGYSQLSTAAAPYHPFLYANGHMTDLAIGPFQGTTNDSALAINNHGQVVGSAQLANGQLDAFLYFNGTMTDLNTLVTLSDGATLMQAWGINDSGQMAVEGSDGHGYLINPPNPAQSLAVLNPFASAAALEQAPSTVSIPTILSTAPPAASLAADGNSAAVVVYTSTTLGAVVLALSAGVTLPPGAQAGSLGAFDPDYLVSPRPTTGTTSLQIPNPSYGPDAAGNYYFVALLWAPPAFPVPDAVPAVVPLQINATQQGENARTATVYLEPPPLLLVHDLWSSAAAAQFTPGSGGFNDYISSAYPHNLIFPVDYGAANSKSFTDPAVQSVFLAGVTDALATAAQDGMVARSVDVVGHGTGGLVARAFLSTQQTTPDLLPDSIHKLVTIGTPHLGTQLIATLVNNQNVTTAHASTAAPAVQVWCQGFSTCTLADVMTVLGRPLAAGAQSIEPNSTALDSLSSTTSFSAMAGSAPSPPASSESATDILIGAFLSGQTVSTILNGQANDTLIPDASQIPSGSSDSAPAIENIVHQSSCGACDVAETVSTSVWAQAYHWLTGGTGAVGTQQDYVSDMGRIRPKTSAGPAPMLTFSGYTEVPASNVTFQPPSGSTLTIGAEANITAMSSTKTITEVLLVQSVLDPSDTDLFSATIAPFSVPFTPIRLGSANFGAIVAFSDKTYAIVPLNYTLTPAGSPISLTLGNAPVANIPVGSSRVITTQALFGNGLVDVTHAAAYSAGSGSTAVFSIGANGAITAAGDGSDILNVAYSGVTASATISVGPCTYSVSPPNQIVPYTGASVTLQVTTQSGCRWTAGGGASWLTFNEASGFGSGTITLTASANSSQAVQAAIVNLGAASAIVTQPTGACTYTLSATQISANAAGASGTVTATSACPVTASSNQSWLTAMPVGSAVNYTIAPNSTGALRSATLTIGTVNLQVSQGGGAPPPCAVSGDASPSIADVQQMIRESLGTLKPANNLSGGGVVNVVDIQIAVNAATGLGCEL